MHRHAGPQFSHELPHRFRRCGKYSVIGRASQDRKGWLAQRHDVFVAGLHPPSRNCPQGRVEVDVAPADAPIPEIAGDAENFRASGGCERNELKGARGRRCIGPQLGHELVGLLVGQGGMVAGSLFVACGEFVFEVALPPGRVLPFRPARSSTVSMRPRTRDAVSGMRCQIGLRMVIMSSVVIVSTGLRPIIGST
jgi:hypothetical protein